MPKNKSESIGSDNVNLDRIEDKYVVEKKYLAETISEVTSHLKPYYPDDETAFTLVRSIYFDSAHFTFLKQHLMKEDDRRKIRIRTYGPDGNWENVHYLEEKYKNNGKSKKQRIKINQDMFDGLMAGKKLICTPELYKLNFDVKEADLDKKVQLMSYLMLVNKVQPVCEISYKRYAYQQGKLRVTIDQDIKVKPLQLFKKSDIESLKSSSLWEDFKEYGNKFSNADNFMLEVKHEKDIPLWIKTLINKIDTEPCAFSKYVFAMYQIMNTLLNIKR
jgi:SPX domain protein involved in polyphosphate accumulation